MPGGEAIGGQVAGVSVPEGGSVGAESSKVRSRPDTGRSPACDIRSVFPPPGATSKAFMSPGKVWLRLESVTVTLPSRPTKLDTLMTDGYGRAGPDSCCQGGYGAVGSGMRMVLVLANVWVYGRLKTKLTGG